MTRILIISDVHANLTALEAVLADAGQVDETWCLGDIIGYGPDPNECIDRIRNLPNLTCLMGNHDLAATGDLLLETFNHDARKSLVWQQNKLTPDGMDFLKGLPQVLKVRDLFSMAHGSPRDPIWEYILNTMTAGSNLDYFETPWCCVGHSHFQVIFQYDPQEDEVNIEVPQSEQRYALTDRAILNPGSVGQPRDRDSRAAYAIYFPDEKIWQPRRVFYDVQTVQSRILQAGLPDRHAERLTGGW